MHAIVCKLHTRWHRPLCVHPQGVCLLITPLIFIWWPPCVRVNTPTWCSSPSYPHPNNIVLGVGELHYSMTARLFGFENRNPCQFSSFRKLETTFIKKGRRLNFVVLVVLKVEWILTLKHCSRDVLSNRGGVSVFFLWARVFCGGSLTGFCERIINLGLLGLPRECFCQQFSPYSFMVDVLISSCMVKISYINVDVLI